VEADTTMINDILHCGKCSRARQNAFATRIRHTPASPTRCYRPRREGRAVLSPAMTTCGPATTPGNAKRRLERTNFRGQETWCGITHYLAWAYGAAEPGMTNHSLRAYRVPTHSARWARLRSSDRPRIVYNDRLSTGHGRDPTPSSGCPCLAISPCPRLLDRTPSTLFGPHG